MKKIITTCALIFSLSVCLGQTMDTLIILKEKAMSYTSHELKRPKTYVSIAWSNIFIINNGIRIINVFKAKTNQEKWKKYSYTFDFDNDLELIAVNTDSPEKQIKDAKAEIRKANEQIKRINETADRKIEALSDH